MKKETIVWTIVLLLGAVGLIINAAVRHAGEIHVKDVQHDYFHVADKLDVPWGKPIVVPRTQTGPVKFELPSGEIMEIKPPSDGETVQLPWKDGVTVPARWRKVWKRTADHAPGDIPLPEIGSPDRVTWTSQTQVDYKDFVAESKKYEKEKEAGTVTGQNPYHLSLSRSVGLWVGAFFTLAIFSFLYKDNVFYKIAEAVVVGVSAAYWMVVSFWDVIVPNLMGKLAPEMVKNWARPGMEGEVEWLYLVPLILGIMLLWRLSPKGAWISRWPLAFIIGTTAGMRMVSFIHADTLSQLRNSIKPLYNPVDAAGHSVWHGGELIGQADTYMSIWSSLAAIIIVVGVLATLVYFFFSVEHKGIVGRTAKLGIWFLMITFGAAFGYTVMGRIALLAIRVEFLVDDWLWLIDPLHKRLISG